MGGYVEDNDEEPQRRGFNFFGTDVSKIPCFKHSFMYAIGSGTAAGVIYNLALSRNPMKLAFGTYTVVLFGYYAVCRYDYRMREAEMKKIKHVMKDVAYLEGTETMKEAEKWAAEAHLKKKTEIRNFRSDIKTDEES